MTNTIHNVPRELLERAANMLTMGSVAADIREELRALLSAPSPAGVDGLEAVGYLTPYALEVDMQQPDDEPLCRLSDAQAIIDGLRGEVAKHAETIANYKLQFSELHAARNLLSRLSMAGFELGDDAVKYLMPARRTESAGLSYEQCAWVDGWNDCLDKFTSLNAALSAGKEGE